MRRRLSRAHWAARLLGLPVARPGPHRKGVILVQIDGLSYRQFMNALGKKRLRHLGRLLRRESLKAHDFYSGVPSTTPAVQGELFYGKRMAVPAFQFLHRKSGKVFRMYDAGAADVIERELLSGGKAPLLKGGRSYSNIYRAGAEKSWYCSGDLSPEGMWRRAKLWRWLLIAFVYLPKIVRMAGLALLELLLALVDFFRGIYEREHVARELIIVPARVGICILLREFIRLRTILDIEEGVEVIHANFLGYDEQAHRRGPDSEFAHWTLKGIDRTIRDIHAAASRSDAVDYELIVYSDHGQERTVPYQRKFGRELEDDLRAVLLRGEFAGCSLSVAGGIQKVAGKAGRRRSSDGEGAGEGGAIVVTAMGPLGHVYFPEAIEGKRLRTHAGELVKETGIPLVLFREGGIVFAVTKAGEFRLPEDGKVLLGESHPFGDEAAADLAEVVLHENAGDLVLSGWNLHGEKISFPAENGAHGGPGADETHGFLLLPEALDHEPPVVKERAPIRAEDLRRVVLDFLGEQRRLRPRSWKPAERDGRTLRVMTYNIHSCVGTDGRLRPGRIARVIERCGPDLVAVQEVDAHRLRSGHFHQAEMIASHLGADHVFHSMLEEDEKYGIAVFSMKPFVTVKSGLLTRAEPRRYREARGAIHLRLEVAGRAVHFFNTHFGLGVDERNRQAAILLGEDWMGSVPEDEPAILCGDFNSRKRSVVWKKLDAKWRAAWVEGGPGPTFPSFRPVAMLDHVFASGHFTVRNAWVPRNHLTETASDHLPLVVDLQLDEER